jgi:hypothetical protein
MPRYKSSLCHTPIKPDLLVFPGIGVFACRLCDHVITRFASAPKLVDLRVLGIKTPLQAELLRLGRLRGYEPSFYYY